MKKKFGMVISNPPYQEETDNTSDKPVYNTIMDAANKIAEKTVLITPARFLFNAGKTPKDFNRRMLNDEHFKVLDYAPDAKKYFRGVDIEGGVAITMHDETKTFEPIGTFIPFDELKSIHQKVVVDNENFQPLSQIIYAPESFHFTQKFHADNPAAAALLSKGHAFDLTTNIFDKLKDYFFDTRPDDGHEYIKILGRVGVNRTYRWIRRDYINAPAPLEKFKVFLPKSFGRSNLGDKPGQLISRPIIGEPFVGNTETFITIGAFDTRAEADACFAYIKSKFARAMLGILKATQDNKSATWAKVPLQDFTPSGKIDWHGDIDAQLYAAYGLDDSERDFIETHVKEMA